MPGNLPISNITESPKKVKNVSLHCKEKFIILKMFLFPLSLLTVPIVF